MKNSHKLLRGYFWAYRGNHYGPEASIKDCERCYMDKCLKEHDHRYKYLINSPVYITYGNVIVDNNKKLVASDLKNYEHSTIMTHPPKDIPDFEFWGSGVYS